MSLVMRKRSPSVIAVCTCLSLSLLAFSAWTAKAAWHGFDYAEYWNRGGYACIDLRSAEVVQEGALFVFTVNLYGDVSVDTLSDRAFGFQIDPGSGLLPMKVEVRRSEDASSGWQVRIGRHDEHVAELRFTELRTARVDVQEHAVSFFVPMEELGSPSDFSWRAYASAQGSSGNEEVMDRIPDLDEMAHWSTAEPEASCSAFNVAIGSHRPTYEVGDEVILMLYVSIGAEVRVFDTAGGTTVQLFAGTISSGEFDIKDLMGATSLMASPPIGIDALSVEAESSTGCSKTARASVEVTE